MSSLLIARSNVTVTLDLDRGISGAVTCQELATQNRVTGVNSASQVVKALDWLVHATNLGVAVVEGASVVVIAVNGTIDSFVVATNSDTGSSIGNSVTSVDGAGIIIITVNRLVLASISCHVARVVRADVTIVTVEGGADTETSNRAAFLCLARTSCALDFGGESALVARDVGVLATGIGSTRSTRVCSARTAIITVLRAGLATNSRVTVNHSARVAVHTDNVGSVAATGRVA